jgi:hypothetical protein
VTRIVSTKIIRWSSRSEINGNDTQERVPKEIYSRCKPYKVCLSHSICGRVSTRKSTVGFRPPSSKLFNSDHRLGPTCYNFHYTLKPIVRTEPIRSGTSSGNRKNNPHPSKVAILNGFRIISGIVPGSENECMVCWSVYSRNSQLGVSRQIFRASLTKLTGMSQEALSNVCAPTSADPRIKMNTRAFSKVAGELSLHNIYEFRIHWTERFYF